MFEPDEIDDGQKSPTLGPGYFAARKFSEQLVAGVDAEIFQPILKKASDDFYSQIKDALEAFLISDVESNVQGEIWRTADNIVQALLTGEDWAMKKYLIGDRYDCAKVRATVAAYVPKELQDARVADLEQQVVALKKDNEFYRRTR